MKLKFFYLTLWSLLLCETAFAQKYSTLDQYKNYFLTSNNPLSDIEGIWQVNTTAYVNGRLSKRLEYTVVIVKDGYEFKEYQFKNGVYSPNTTDYTFSFFLLKNSTWYYNMSSKQDNSSLFRDKNRVTINLNSTNFNCSKNSSEFSFRLDITKYMKYEFTKNGDDPNFIEESYHSRKYSRIFPLPGDIENFDNLNKVEKTSGTGCAISSNGIIATNFHVIEGAKNIKVKGINSDFNKSYKAKILLFDKNNDLALIQIDDYGFTSLGAIPYTIKTGLSGVGENIFVLGYPLRVTMGDEIKVTNGIISSHTGFQGDVTSYQISAPVQPGNSGGPLFDSQGNLIGIINAKHVGAENASYAIKSSYLKNLIDLLQSSPKLQTVNSLTGKTLIKQVELTKKFVYIIETE